MLLGSAIAASVMLRATASRSRSSISRNDQRRLAHAGAMERSSLAIVRNACSIPS